MAYQTISAILEAGNASSGFKQIATTYGINADYPLSVTVSDTLRHCFRASCQTSKSCTDSNASTYSDFNEIDTWQQDILLQWLVYM